MAQAVRALVVLDPAVPRDEVVSALPTDGVEVVAMIDGFSDVEDALQHTRADMIVVACDHASESVIEMIADARRKRPERPVVVLCSGAPNGFVRRVFDAGADDIVELPQSAENVQFLIEKAIARRQRPDRDPARTIAVLGPKGGTGKTLTSCNLGVLLASQGHRTVIIDVDLQFGDVGLALGLKPERTIYDLVQTGGSLDAEKIEGFAIKHFSGASALLAPTRPDQAAVVTTAFLRDLFTIARRSYDFVIVDTAPAFSPEVIVAIDASSRLCIVGMLDALSLKDTKIGLETLKQMGYSSDDVALVLNRADSSVGISMSDVYSLLKKDPDILVP